MKAMVIGFVAAVAIAVGASVALGTLDGSTASRYATEAVRL